MTILVGRIGFIGEIDGSISETLNIASSAAWESNTVLALSGFVAETGNVSFVGEVVGNTLPPFGEAFDPDVMLFADDGSLSFVVGAETSHDIDDVLIHSWQFGGPEDSDLTVNNPSGVVYVQGNDFEDASWRIKVAGIHPDDPLSIDHRQTMSEEDITLDDAKVASVEADLSTTVENKFYATVATDTRSNQSVPPALTGSMAGRMVEWDGAVWMHYDDHWVSKAEFLNSLFSDRGVFRRMNIINTDPNDGLVYPPVPVAGGITLGSRFANVEGTIGAHLSMVTADGIFGTIPFMVHGGPPAFGLTPNVWASILDDNTAVATEYGRVISTTVNYNLGDRIVMDGTSYLNIEPGFQPEGFLANIDKWEPQDRDQVMNSAMISASGDILVDASGNIMRGFAT